MLGIVLSIILGVSLLVLNPAQAVPWSLHALLIWHIAVGLLIPVAMTIYTASEAIATWRSNPENESGGSRIVTAVRENAELVLATVATVAMGWLYFIGTMLFTDALVYQVTWHEDYGLGGLIAYGIAALIQCVMIKIALGDDLEL